MRTICILAAGALALTSCIPAKTTSSPEPVAGGLPAADGPKVLLETSMGNITIGLYEKQAPITVKNFLQYVDDKHYDGTIFHRVMPDFMIQGGGFQPGMKEKPTRGPIKNESGNGLSNQRGTVAMARTNALDSATAQFFINVVNNDKLDKPKYCVFGKVLEGMDVVDRIREVRTRDVGGHEAVPFDDVIIKSARRVDQ